MPDTKNIITDSLNIVQSQQIRGLFRPPTISAEMGFSKELFRSGTHYGSVRFDDTAKTVQSLEAKNGDILYHINLGSIIQIIEGQLRTNDGYIRSYRVTVELQIAQPAHFLAIYRQGGDPVNLAILGIKDTLHKYAAYTDHGQMSHMNLSSKAMYAFDRERENCKAGIKIIRAYQPYLGKDENYQPFNSNPLLTIEGSLTTYEGYVRDYTLSAEMQVCDAQEYKHFEQTDTPPLKRAHIAITGEVAKHAQDFLYKELSESQIRTFIEDGFGRLSNQFTGGMQVTHIHHLSLRDDISYVPIQRSPIPDIEGKVTTREGYVRGYTLKAELQVIDQRQYLQLKHEGTEPLEMAKITIKGEIEKHARELFYEDLSEVQLQAVVEHAFDQLNNRLTGGMKIIRAHSFSLGEDSTYKPFNSSPLLPVNSQLTTREGYVRDYEAQVELFITDRRAYQLLLYEGADPLERARTAINGAIQESARQQLYETLSESQLRNTIEHAFDRSTSQVTTNLTVVRVYKFSLYDAPDYINLGPQMLPLTGKLHTTDHRERTYKMIAELKIVDPAEFVQLTRQGNDPLNLARNIIEGTILDIADGKAHDQLSEVNFAQAISNKLKSSISLAAGGMELVNIHKIELHIDPRIQEKNAIIYQTEVETTKLEQQNAQRALKQQQDHNFSLATKQQEYKLSQTQISIENERYAFEQSKLSRTDSYQIQREIVRMALSHVSNDLEHGISIDQIGDDIRALSRIANAHAQSRTRTQV